MGKSLINICQSLKHDFVKDRLEWPLNVEFCDKAESSDSFTKWNQEYLWSCQGTLK